MKRQRAKAKSVAERLGTESDSDRDADRGNDSIREEEAQKKPMAVEEAVIELNHSNYPFLVFRNSDSGAVNVLYRRKDGTLGLIRA